MLVAIDGPAGAGKSTVARALARGVALVAQRLLDEHRLHVGAELRRAPACALARIGREEDLQRSVGSDDGADVASLRDPIAALDQLALLGHERLAYAGVGGDA